MFLISLGGVVTSEKAGMSVPDWPTSYGYNMFFFPWQQMSGGIFWEHSHRLVASGVGLLVLGLAIALCFQPRLWLRWLGGAAAVMIAVQALLGGLRVTLMKDQIGIFHACLAQAVLVVVALIAFFTSRWWLQAQPQTPPRYWREAALATTLLIFVQLAIGSTMRHEHAGLSIKDFPTAYGQAWPATDPAAMVAYNRQRLAEHEVATTPLAIQVQMAHRIGAVLIVIAILSLTVLAWRTGGVARFLRRGTAIWVGLVAAQFTLGALTIWTNKAADIATTHVAIGALTLVTGALLAAGAIRLGRGARERHPIGVA